MERMIRDEDWIKVGSGGGGWDLTVVRGERYGEKVATLDELQDALAGMMDLDDFMALPAAEAMPDELKAAVHARSRVE